MSFLRTLKHLLIAIPLILVLTLGFYVLSVIWRVSVAEQNLFGRSDLIPLSLKKPAYTTQNKTTPDAYGSGTFIYNRSGTPVVVWRQEINGFQHIYGSALAAYELGDKPADMLFCANEYAEAFFDFIFDPNGIGPEDLKDRRKDLRHNRTGREVGIIVRNSPPEGMSSEELIQQTILDRMAGKDGYFPHYNDPAIAKLPTETQMGCPLLPPVVSWKSLFRA